MNFKFPNLKRLFKSEDSRFIMSVGLKVSLISFAVTVFIYFLLFEIMRLNYAFFQSQGAPALMDQDSFFGYIATEALDNALVLFLFHIFLFFIGTYVGWLILRPFKTIGDYSETVLDNLNAIYKIDEFSHYNLLTRFSEFFFEYLRESRKKGEILSNSIPPQFSRIHKPVADKVFMLHFGILLVIICICSAVFITENISAVYSSMVELSTKIIANSKAASSYISRQLFVLEDLLTLTVILTSFCYILLGIHLYSKVSGAAFGIFSTMRSFMKGNYSSRVHLVGYAYVREYTRKLNKYLDYIQNNFTKSKRGD